MATEAKKILLRIPLDLYGELVSQARERRVSLTKLIITRMYISKNAGGDTESDTEVVACTGCGALNGMHFRQCKQA